MLDVLEEKAKNWFRGLFGDTNEKKLKTLVEKVNLANNFAADFERLTDDDLKRKSVSFRETIDNALKGVEDKDLIAPDAPKMPGHFRTEKDRVLAGVLEEILPEAFAVCREASWRVLGMRHFDVQLIGGAALHNNKISEMRTGEGKTLVATLPAYLNGLTGRGVHVVTVNDYLARRDAEWMGRLYRFLGLSTGTVFSHQPDQEKYAAYRADITYGTNHEFGFDYLRDNMRTSLEDLAQRPYYMAIVDEVDNILIDEARTPLIISGFPTESYVEIYKTMAQVAPMLERGRDKDDEDCDYWVDEKTKNVLLTERGHTSAEKILGVSDLYDVRWNLAHHVCQAIRAKELYRKDTDYVVRVNEEGKPEVVIVDEFTGRMMIGRRWSDGLHQAVEAKEGVPIQEETMTYASITYQNLFRLYPKLAGMTGTAMTEANEFSKIYNLDVVAIPTNKPSIRTDYPDVVYKTEKQKFYSVVEEIVEMHEIGRPVLVGTTSIEKSEVCAALMESPQKMGEFLTRKLKKIVDELKNRKLQGESINALNAIFERPGLIDPEKFEKAITEFEKEFPKQGELSDYLYSTARTARVVASIRKGIPYHVLNAKNHEKEAMIVAQAGKKGAVTIATNMAGRGTDILLGGNPEYMAKEQLEQQGVSHNEVDYDDQVKVLTKKFKEQTNREHDEVVDLGGLHIVGTERHEARRIDNQLRGRAGRQGDPGSSRFFLSLEDTLMKIFGGERIAKMMDWMQADEEIPIEHDMVSKSIANAQKKVEAHHFDMRKHVLQYDDVLNTQREHIYRDRKRILEKDDLKDLILDLLDQHVLIAIGSHIDPESPPESWEDEALPTLLKVLSADIPMLTDLEMREFSGLSFVDLEAKLRESARLAYDVREEHIGSETLREIERQVLLRTIDGKWVDHLHNIELVREAIHLRGYGQRDPLQEYKREAFGMYEELIGSIRQETVHLMFHVAPNAATGGGQGLPSGDMPMDMAELENMLLEMGIDLDDDSREALAKLHSGGGIENVTALLDAATANLQSAEDAEADLLALEATDFMSDFYDALHDDEDDENSTPVAAIQAAQESKHNGQNGDSKSPESTDFMNEFYDTLHEGEDSSTSVAATPAALQSDDANAADSPEPEKEGTGTPILQAELSSSKPPEASS